MKRHILALPALALLVHILGAPEAVAKDMESDYRELVKNLASPNTPIKCDNEEGTLSIPPNYDWKAQKRIEKNRRILFDHCDEALPLLIEGCTDARYSLTSPWAEDHVYSWCVGEVCLDIVATRVEVFREQMRFSLPAWHRYSFVPRLHAAIGKNVTEKKKKEIRDWWQKRKGKSVRDLQIEAFDWAIKKRTNEFASAVGEQRSTMSDEVQKLTATRDRLHRSNKSLPPENVSLPVLSPKGYNGFRVIPWDDGRN
ncbi:MAG: hypothetical protein LLG00_03355 [Planctomycetaceae bacterium]|nr:hypothetical protein [Planctomycetaceae bacterium]